MFFIFRNSYYRYFSPPSLQPPIVFILPSHLELFAVVVLVFSFTCLFGQYPHLILIPLACLLSFIYVLHNYLDHLNSCGIVGDKGE